MSGDRAGGISPRVEVRTHLVCGLCHPAGGGGSLEKASQGTMTLDLGFQEKGRRRGLGEEGFPGAGAKEGGGFWKESVGSSEPCDETEWLAGKWAGPISIRSQTQGWR